MLTCNAELVSQRDERQGFYEEVAEITDGTMLNCMQEGQFKASDKTMIYVNGCVLMLIRKRRGGRKRSSRRRGRLGRDQTEPLWALSLLRMLELSFLLRIWPAEGLLGFGPELPSGECSGEERGEPLP